MKKGLGSIPKGLAWINGKKNHHQQHQKKLRKNHSLNR